MGSESPDTGMSFPWIACLCLASIPPSPSLARDVLLHSMDRANPQGPHFRKFLESPSLRLVSGGVPLTLTQTQTHSVSSLLPQDLSLVTTSLHGPSLNNLDLVSSPESVLESEGGLGDQGDLLIQGNQGDLLIQGGLGGEVGGGLLLPV